MKKHKKLSKIIFVLSIIIIFTCLLYGLYKYFSYKSSQKKSEQLLDTYMLLSIYSNTINNFENTNSSNSPPIIGRIEISKININYPIISYLSDEYLKLAPCRFYGPLPNEVGNLCIAGHNYNNGKFFSNLNKLENHDIIKIYDSNNTFVNYEVYSIFKVEESNLSVLSKNIVYSKEITLITCDNITKKRLVIKAKETNYLK